MAPKFINDHEARRALENAYEELFNRLERALEEFSTRKDTIIQPVRSCLNIPKHSDQIQPGTMFLTMPAYSQCDRAISTKLLSMFPGNKDCAVINSTIALFDVDNGLLQAVMDGNAITEIRTAMASAIACHHLSLSTDRRRIQHLAILGSGVQARGHIDVFNSIFNIDKITIWSRTHANAQRLAREKMNATAFRTIEETVKNADVIVTATNSSEPILKADWLEDKVLICSVGACRPDCRELDDAVMTSSVIVTDSREAALEEAGDIVQTGVEIRAEIGEIINGARGVEEKCTRIVFKSLGMAVEDTVAAKLVLELAGKNK